MVADDDSDDSDDSDVRAWMSFVRRTLPAMTTRVVADRTRSCLSTTMVLVLHVRVKSLHQRHFDAGRFPLLTS